VSPFTSIGEQARWKVLYALLTTRNLDDVLTYKEMGEALDVDADTDRRTIQLAFRRAAREYENVNNRATEAIPNEGYRIVEPAEHLRLANKHQRKSHRELVRGRSKVVHVDLTGMEPDIRKAFELTSRAFSMLIDYSRRLDTRQDQLAQSLDSMVTRQDRSEAEVAKLKDRLAHLEQQRNA
jgi:hypothetical protein